MQRKGTILDFSHIKGMIPAEVSLRSVTRGLPRQGQTVIHRAAMPYADVPSFHKNAASTSGFAAAAVTGTLSISIRPRDCWAKPLAMARPRPVPLPAPSRDEVTDEADTGLAAVPHGTGGAGEHILVVEDSDEVLELATEILTGVGYRVTTATSGDEALAFINALGNNGSFDLLFTDLVMPGGMNGLMLAEQASLLVPGIGVLMTTGYNEELVDDRHARTNADILSKPYRRSELLDRVRQALNSRGSEQERRRSSEYGTAEA